MSLTAAQQQAVQAEGNVLVMAGAGTGKTRALVERALYCLLNTDPRASLDEILVVTFTEAAAAEMRQRIRSRLEEEAAASPADPHWQEQMALFETAHLGTLHSFCYKLIRQHFYELELDPQVTVMAEEEAGLLAEETLEDLLQRSYEGKGSDAEAVQHLIQAQGKGSDHALRTLVLKLHHYTQTLPAPQAWFSAQIQRFANPQPESWRAWLLEAINDWFQRCPPVFQALAADNGVAAQCHAVLATVSQPPQLAAALEALQGVNSAAKACPTKKRTAWLKPLQPCLEEASFLSSLAPNGNADPVLDDWTWVRGPMATLLGLAQEFATAFARAKRELGAVDFHDLEQHALRLLWDAKAGQPTSIASHWRRQLRFVLVDEYQDINAAQDQILQALSREGQDANRFLVGDVKQSIYRFRLASPGIFQGYAAAWGAVRGSPPSGAAAKLNGQVIPLVENFRSRQGILSFINCVFETTMRRDLGGVEYDLSARLVFGAPEQRQSISERLDSPPVELHVRIKTNLELETEIPTGMEELAELEDAAKEARVVAARLSELQAEQHQVWDVQLKQLRPAAWSDMAVLLRAPSGKSEIYAKEFARLGVPLHVERGGFYRSSEVSDLLSLLQLLDNPLQDLPALAVLRSPLVGLSLEQLAAIRLAAPKAPFWTALVRWHEVRSGDKLRPAERTQLNLFSEPLKLQQKVSVFLERFRRWRRLARQSSLSHCLETILAETHYSAWLQFQPRGEERRHNVQRLLGLAQHFDQLQRQGLFRFLRFIEAQQRVGTEPEAASVTAENAVRLLSIHQSKGLEFPIVVAADLAKPFNTQDLRAEIILDDEFGLCPQVTPPRIRKRYPSLAHWLASRRQKRELLGEELRLLYVAMTRARDLLLLTCSLSQKRYDQIWGPGQEPPPPAEARSCADWLARALGQFAPPGDETERPATICVGESSGACHLRWRVHRDSTLAHPATAAKLALGVQRGKDVILSGPERRQVRQRLAWQYPFGKAARQPAKATVSALRRAMFDVEFQPSASDTSAGSLRPASPFGLRTSDCGLDIGTAHHAFQQFVALDKTGSAAGLRQEAIRLREQGFLSADQVKLLDLEALATFWRSELGEHVRAQSRSARRELPFTFRLSLEELERITRQQAPARGPPGLPEGEFIIVQGVADLAVILPGEIWLVDYKTDQVARGAEPPASRYAPQLKLYARALSLIYRRPVTQCWLWFLGLGRGVQVEV